MIKFHYDIQTEFNLKLNPNFTDQIKMEEDTDKWQEHGLEHFGNSEENLDIDLDAGRDAYQIFPDTLDDGDSADVPDIISVHMDITSSIQTFKDLLQQKTKKSLSNYNVWLKNEPKKIVRKLELFNNLVDECFAVEGFVQVDAQIFDGPKRINIVDVIIPLADCKCTKIENKFSTEIICDTSASNLFMIFIKLK